jgi:hypothetical protein
VLNCWFFVRNVFVIKLGSLGRAKIIMADRQAATFPTRNV